MLLRVTIYSPNGAMEMSLAGRSHVESVRLKAESTLKKPGLERGRP
jgi:hypothetical protein